MGRWFITALVLTGLAMGVPAEATDNSQKQAEKAAKKAAKQAERAADAKFNAWYEQDAYGQPFPGVTSEQLFRAALYVSENSGVISFTDPKLYLLTFRVIDPDGEYDVSSGVQVDSQGISHLRVRVILAYNPSITGAYALGPPFTVKNYIRDIYEFLKNRD